MIRQVLIGAALMASSAAYGACSVSEGIELCFDLADPDLSKVLTDKSELADINGDEINDIIKVDPESNELMIYLGRECSGDISSQCFRQPHFTGILNNKGFLVKDVSGDGKADLTVRTSTDQIQVYAQPGPVLDDGSRSGEGGIISFIGTYGLTEESYTAQSILLNSRLERAFNGYGGSGRVLDGNNSGVYQYGLEPYEADYYDRTPDDQWITVEYLGKASVRSYEIYGAGVGVAGFISLETSNDGVNYIIHHAIRATIHRSCLSVSKCVSTINLNKPTPFAKYIRLVIHQSAQSKLTIDELLLKGWVKAAE